MGWRRHWAMNGKRNNWPGVAPEAYQYGAQAAAGRQIIITTWPGPDGGGGGNGCGGTGEWHLPAGFINEMESYRDQTSNCKGRVIRGGFKGSLSGYSVAFCAALDTCKIIVGGVTRTDAGIEIWDYVATGSSRMWVCFVFRRLYNSLRPVDVNLIRGFVPRWHNGLLFGSMLGVGCCLFQSVQLRWSALLDKGI